MDPSLLPDSVKVLFNPIVNNTILEYWSNGMYQLTNLYKLLNSVKEDSNDEELREAIKKYQDDIDKKKALKTLNNFTINSLTRNIVDNYNEFNEIYENIVEQKDLLFKRLSYMATKFQNKSGLNNLFKMLLFLNKTFPWWVEMVITNIKIEFNDKICNDYITILNSLNELLKDESIEYCNKFEIYKTILSVIDYFERNIKIECFNIIDSNDSKVKNSKTCPKQDQKSSLLINPVKIEQKPTSNKLKILKSIDQQELEDLPKEEQDRLIEINDIKFSNVTVDFLQKLKEITNSDENLSKQNPSEISRIAQETSVFKKPLPIPLKAPKIIPKGETIVTSEPIKIEPNPDKVKMGYDELGGGQPINIQNKNPGSKITSEMLNNFYKNTYKCNLGNYLKSFIPIIKEVDSKYPDNIIVNINLQNDSSKDLIIKILLIYIEYINTSFIPQINKNSIINELQKINKTFSDEQLNTIKNIYSKQLDIYMVIDGIIKGQELSNIDLINIINDNLNYTVYNSLHIPFSLFQLKYKLMKGDIVNDTGKGFGLQSIIPKIDYTKFYPSNPSNLNIFNSQKPIPVYGGISLKHTKNKKILKTMRNKNRNINRNKKNTIKRKNKKIRRHTRKH